MSGYVAPAMVELANGEGDTSLAQREVVVAIACSDVCTITIPCGAPDVIVLPVPPLD